ncbi:MAG: cohesin domain-containing protein [Candidatus Gottesmanbacteria bacterium]
MISLLNLFVVSAASAAMSFSQPPVNVPVGQEFKVAVLASSGGTQTLGTDAVITYDPKMLTVTKISRGSLYALYPPNLEDIDNVLGKAKFSGTSNTISPQIIDGILGWIYFRGKKIGDTQISIDWRPGSTNDSNIVPLTGEIDLLTVEPAKISVNFVEATTTQGFFNFIHRLLTLEFLNI